MVTGLKIPHQTPLLRGAFAALVVDRVVVVFCFNHVSWLFFVSNLPGDARETTRRRPVVSRSCPGRLPVVSRSSPGRLPVVSRETTGRRPGDDRETTGRRPGHDRETTGRLLVVSRASPGRLETKNNHDTWLKQKTTTTRSTTRAAKAPLKRGVWWGIFRPVTTTEMLTWGCGRGYEA